MRNRSRKNLVEAWKDALAGDPTSAFGGVLITNKEVCLETAMEIDKIFYEVLIAPKFTTEALKILKKKNKRIILQQKKITLPNKQLRSILNVILHKEKDLKTDTIKDMKTVTKSIPSNKQLIDLVLLQKSANTLNQILFCCKKRTIMCKRCWANFQSGRS